MATTRYILTIDEGTTSTRALLVDHSGSIITSAQKEFTQIFPKPGWVEQDPLEIWQAVTWTIAQVLMKSQIDPSQIAGIGITNQRETTVIWDKKTGLPIYNAVVWQSRQSDDIAVDLQTQGYQDLIHQRTGLTIDPYFSATKIRWLLDHVPNAQAKAEAGELCFGTIDTWLTWQLTGGKRHVTDYTNASRTMLFNIQDLTWDDTILKLLRIPKGLLPEVASNAEVYAHTDPLRFFGQAIPIASLIGDQQAALFGQLAFEPGMVKNTYGTGAFLVMNTGQQPKFSKHRLLTTIGYCLDGELNYALEGSIFVAGSAIQWLRDSLKLVQSADQSEAFAKATSHNDHLYLVPAFTGLGAPYWDAQARGGLFGITRQTQKNDLIRATLQSLAYQTRDVLTVMQADTDIQIPELKVDGGATRNDYLMQFQADILNIPIQRTKVLETTALGATFLAGLAVGFWQDKAELSNCVAKGQRFEPKMPVAQKEKLYQGWQKAVAATQKFKPVQATTKGAKK